MFTLPGDGFRVPDRDLSGSLNWKNVYRVFKNKYIHFKERTKHLRVFLRKRRMNLLLSREDEPLVYIFLLTSAEGKQCISKSTLWWEMSNILWIWGHRSHWWHSRKLPMGWAGGRPGSRREEPNAGGRPAFPGEREPEGVPARGSGSGPGAPGRGRWAGRRRRVLGSSENGDEQLLKEILLHFRLKAVSVLLPGGRLPPPISSMQRLQWRSRLHKRGGQKTGAGDWH